MVSTTSARPSGARPAVPAKMTSSILPPRSVLAPCSPITQLSASTTLDLPEPLGPTTQVTPGSKLSVVAEAKDLNPRRVRLFRYTPASRTPYWGAFHSNGAGPRDPGSSTAGQPPGVGTFACSGSSSAVALPATVCLPRTAEKVQSLFSTNEIGVTTTTMI